MDLNEQMALEPEFWPLALEEFGGDSEEQLQKLLFRFPRLDQDQFFVWREVMPGPLIGLLSRLVAPGKPLPIARRFCGRLMLHDQNRVWLFRALLQMLPIERVPASLLELRLALDLGI